MAKKAGGPVIVIKRPKKGGDGHHGGAWKIAYADFVTAMMAFFLLLWLLGATTEEQRKGISDYFNVITNSGGGSNGVLQGKVIDITDGQRPTAVPVGATPVALMPLPGMGRPLPQPTDDGERREETAFAEIEHSLEEAVKGSPELAGNILVERSRDGLRIQLIDQERSPMFASGSAIIVPRMEQLLKLVAAMIAQVPNSIAVGGHTDAHPLARGDYSNWELSAERANAARRLLVANGVPDARVVRVSGLADRQPLIKGDPMAASNRRISILLMSMRAEQGAAS